LRSCAQKIMKIRQYL